MNSASLCGLVVSLYSHLLIAFIFIHAYTAFPLDDSDNEESHGMPSEEFMRNNECIKKHRNSSLNVLNAKQPVMELTK